MKYNPITVTDLNKYIKEKISDDEYLNSVLVKGEISNFKRHYTGHLYFTLKDENCLIKCVMFKNYAEKLNFSPKDGNKVIVFGTVSVYERDGVYQIYTKAMEEDGVGDLYQKFQELKQKLEKEGFFDQENKMPIPKMPKVIGVLTSKTGSVVKDIINVSTRRNPNVVLRIYPVPVQGEGAAQKIANAIEYMNRNKLADVLILARGGGSLEDLWPFNEEIVAKAIYYSELPIISAVGHETDFTIADFVADLRAPTPSAAAELAVNDYRSVVESVSVYRQRMYRAMSTRLDFYRSRLANFSTKFGYLSPEYRLREQRQRLADVESSLQNAMEGKLKENRHRLSLYVERFTGLSPLRKLNQGFSYVADQEKRTLTSVKQVKNGDTIYISVTDGTIEAKVNSIKKEERIHVQG